MPHVGNVFWAAKRLPEESRTLTCRVSGTIPNHGDDKIGDVEPGGDLGDAYIKEIKGFFTLIAPGSDPALSPGIITITPGGARALGFQVSVADGFGGSDAYDGRTDFIRTLHHADSNDSSYTAEWTIGPCKRYFELYFKDTGVAGANGEVTYGGPASGNVLPRGLGIRWYEVAEAGAIVTASVNVSGPHTTASASCSTTLESDFVIPSYLCYAEPFIEIFNNLGTEVGTMDATFEGDYQHIGPSTTLNDTDGVMEVGISSGNIAVTVTAAFVAGGTTNFNGGGRLTGEPDRRYRVTGHLYALDQDYPGSLVLGILGSPDGEPNSVTLNPDGTVDFTQRTYLAESIHSDGSYHTLGSASEWDNVLTYLTSDSLETAGEDPNDWVTCIYDSPYSALSLSHASETALPDPSESGGVWIYTWPVGTPGNWEGYAYLKVTLKTDTIGEEVTLTCDSDPGKTYKITTTSTALTDYTVDLCRPETPEPDDNPELWDSRYPLRNDGLPHNDPSGWGIARIRGYTLSGGTNLDVDGLTLFRKSAPVQDAVPAFNDWELVQTDESYHADGSVGSVPIIQGTRGVVVNVDGRRSIIEPCAVRQLESDGAGGLMWVYSYRTARDFEATATACPGFVCGESPYVPADAWRALDGSEGANFIDGGPIYLAGWSGFHDGGGVTWALNVPTNHLGKTYATGQTIYYCPYYHEILIPPAFGDPWDGGYANPTPVRVAKILRAAADGIVVSDPGQTVRLLDGATVVSSGTSDTNLRFRQNVAPYGKGQKDHTVRCNGVDGSLVGSWDPEQGLGTDEATQERFNARRWHRAVFRTAAQPLLSHFYRTSADLTHYRGFVDSGRIYVGVAPNATPADFTDRDTSVDAAWVAGCADRLGKDRRLYVAYGDGSTVNLAHLTDDYGGLSMPISLGAGTQGEPLMSDDNTIRAYRNDGGVIKCKVFDADLNEIDAFDTNITDADTDRPLSLDDSLKGDNGWRVGMFYYVGGVPTLVFSDNGQTFS